MLLNKRIPITFFFGKVKFEFLMITIYSIVAAILDHHTFLAEFNIPLTLMAILGTAISLLLAFRTSQSYDRWWEARIVWGAIVNDSRTIIRQLKNFLDNNDEQFEFLKQFTRKQIAWSYCLAQSLRKKIDIARLEECFDLKNLENYKDSPELPNLLLDIQGEDLNKAYKNKWINEFQHIQLDSTLARLTDSMGKCERIKKTVFPKSYSLQIHFFIYVFATILPFALSGCSIWVEILLTITLTSVFFLIEKTAIYMQDPFENRPTDIPINAIAHTIDVSLSQMIAADVAPAKPNQRYYLL